MVGILEELRFLDLEFLVGEQPFVMEKRCLALAGLASKAVGSAGPHWRERSQGGQRWKAGTPLGFEEELEAPSRCDGPCPRVRD
jgi:hypothetical protein